MYCKFAAMYNLNESLCTKRLQSNSIGILNLEEYPKYPNENKTKSLVPN